MTTDLSTLIKCPRCFGMRVTYGSGVSPACALCHGMFLVPIALGVEYALVVTSKPASKKFCSELRKTHNLGRW